MKPDQARPGTTPQSDRVQKVASILWMNGDDSWEGRRPDWHEIVAGPKFMAERITTEEHAKSLLYMAADDWAEVVRLRAEEDEAHGAELLDERMP